MGLLEKLTQQFEAVDPLGDNLRGAAEALMGDALEAHRLYASSREQASVLLPLLIEEYEQHQESYLALKKPSKRKKGHSEFKKRQDGHITAQDSFEKALNSQVETRARHLARYMMMQGHDKHFEAAANVLREHLKTVHRIGVMQRFTGWRKGKSADDLRLEAAVSLQAKLDQVLGHNKAAIEAVKGKIEEFTLELFESDQMKARKAKVISTGESLNELSFGMLEHFIAMKKIREDIVKITNRTGLSHSHVPQAMKSDGLTVFDMDALVERFNNELSHKKVADRILDGEARLGQTDADRKEGLRPVLAPFMKAEEDAVDAIERIFKAANGGAALPPVPEVSGKAAKVSPPIKSPELEEISARLRKILNSPDDGPGLG